MNRIRIILVGLVFLAYSEQVAHAGLCEKLALLSQSISVGVEDGYQARVQVSGERNSMSISVERGLNGVAQPVILSSVSEILKNLHQDSRPLPVFQKAADAMGLKVITDGRALSEIPESGPLLIIANHPLSGVDGIALAGEISKVRKDTKVVLNQMLQAVPGVKEATIGVDVTNPASRANAQAFREMNTWVKDGHALIIFPAGNVSRRQPDGSIADTEWSKSIVKITQRNGAQVLPVFVHGQPGSIFNALDRVSSSAASSWIPKEILRQRGSTVHLTLGAPISAEKVKVFEDEREAVEFLRRETYQLGEKKR